MHVIGGAGDRACDREEKRLEAVMMQSIMPPLRRKSEQAADIRQRTCPTMSSRFMIATVYGRWSLVTHCSSSPSVGVHMQHGILDAAVCFDN